MLVVMIQNLKDGFKRCYKIRIYKRCRIVQVTNLIKKTV